MATQDKLDGLIDLHRARLIESLYTLENGIIDAIALGKDQTLTVQVAIAKRDELKRIIESTYLVAVDANIREYETIVDIVRQDFKNLDINPAFKMFDKQDMIVIANLKRIIFEQFREAGTTIEKALQQEIYSSALANRPFKDMVDNIRNTIMGVYSGDTPEVIRLRKLFEKNRGNAIGEKIRQKLHGHHAARVSKGSLYSHATQISHDGIMEFHGQTTIFKSEKAGLTKFKYRGSVIGTSRPFCKRHAGKVFNKDEIRRIWKSNSWEGKKPGDPFIVRGGYNCRHHWRPIV